jgi:hypothetical protein
MGIDSIGKSGSGLPPGTVGEVGSPSPAAKTEGFRAEESRPVEAAGGSEALEKLERGELSREEYLDVRVAEATAHLEGRLSAEQLDFVRESLRIQLGTDPVLVELVRRAIGSAPTE